MIRFANPITTTHANARREISRLQHLAINIRPDHPRHGWIKEIYATRITKQQAILTAPNRLVFPTFFSFTYGENTIGISLAGLRCCFPSLARRYGQEQDFGGNCLLYRNWLGTHLDL